MRFHECLIAEPSGFASEAEPSPSAFKQYDTMPEPSRLQFDRVEQFDEQDDPTGPHFWMACPALRLAWLRVVDTMDSSEWLKEAMISVGRCAGSGEGTGSTSIHTLLGLV